MKERILRPICGPILILSLIFTAPSVAYGQQAQRNVLIEAFADPYVYIPTAFGILLSLTDYDGRITRHAGKHRPIYGSTENAKKMSDLITFYFFPAYAAASTAVFVKQNNFKKSKWIQYPSFIFAVGASVLINDLVKSKSGRLRPDSSNLESFPSSHTAIASAFSGHINRNNLYLFQDHKLRTGMSVFNEIMVVAVGWARLEAQKHHLTDTLAGYAIGKFFSHLFHGHIFNEQVNFSLNIQNKENLSTRLTWNF